LKTVFINEIKERDWIESAFLVRDKTMAMAKNGRSYLILKLADRTGEVEGRVWDQVDALTTTFDKDDFVQIKGKASIYLGRMQLTIQDLSRLAEDQVDLGDFLPLASRPMTDMIGELNQYIASIQDIHLRALLEAFVGDETFMRSYSKAPAAKAMHHVYLGGLLEHSLAVAALAELIAGRYSGINRDLLVVGALLHDVGKISELRYERSFEYTDAGKLLGHIMIGIEIIEDKIRTLPGFPPQLAVLLKHLMLSHHGQYDYGSPKRPKTLEAVVLNFIDDLDAKINGIQTHIDKETDRDAAWTQYHKLYDRYFFKGYSNEHSEKMSDPAPSAPTKQDKQPSKRSGQSHFTNTLGDQLRGKNLDLINSMTQEKKRD
jgi:3'-5' exoribonuclease